MTLLAIWDNPTLLEIFGSVLALVLSVFFTWLGKRMKADDATKGALDALNTGVNEVYQTYVRDLKKSNADGKLTPEEAKTARSKALTAAKAVATGPALRVLTTWGVPKLHSVIQDLVNRKKKKG